MSKEWINCMKVLHATNSALDELERQRAEKRKILINLNPKIAERVLDSMVFTHREADRRVFLGLFDKASSAAAMDTICTIQLSDNEYHVLRRYLP